MGLVSGIAVFLLVWWIVLFTVLPWYNRPVDNPETGHVASAPKSPNLKIKFLVTTVISAFIWIGVYGLIEMEIIDYRSIALQMMQEDHAQ